MLSTKKLPRFYVTEMSCWWVVDHKRAPVFRLPVTQQAYSSEFEARMHCAAMNDQWDNRRRTRWQRFKRIWWEQ